MVEAGGQEEFKSHSHTHKIRSVQAETGYPLFPILLARVYGPNKVAKWVQRP